LKESQNNDLFVPYSLCSDNAAVYAQLLGKQNEYMQNHRNILLAGINNNLMMQAPRTQEENKSFKEMIQDQPGVYRVDPIGRILDLGKWNISTDSKHYQALKD
jgi:hypothetical protein